MGGCSGRSPTTDAPGPDHSGTWPRPSPRGSGRRPRWVWASTAEIYPALLRAGVRVERCHDLELTEALLLGRRRPLGRAARARRAWARLPACRCPPTRRRGGRRTARRRPGALFEHRPAGAARRRRAARRGGRRVRRPARAGSRGRRRRRPGRFRLLVAAESAGALVAAEMGRGRAAVARRRARRAAAASCSGPRPAGRGRAAPAGRAGRRIAAAFGGQPLNPDSPAEVLRAFARAGIALPSTRAWVLRERRPPGGAAAAGVQGAVPRLDGARLGLAGRLGARRPVPARVRAGRRGLRPLGHPRRRRAADPQGGAAGGGRRPGLDARGRRRRPAGAAGAGRDGRRRAAGRGRGAPATSTRRWPPTRSAATGPRPRWRCWAPCTGRPAATAAPRWRCCAGGSRPRSGTSRRPRGPARRAGWSAPGSAGPARRRPPRWRRAAPAAGRAAGPPPRRSRAQARRGRPAPAAGSPATSWSRPRAADWALALLPPLRRRPRRDRPAGRAGVLPARRGDRALPAPRTPRRWRPRCARPPRRPAGWCSATPGALPAQRGRGGLLRRRQVTPAATRPRRSRCRAGPAPRGGARPGS